VKVTGGEKTTKISISAKIAVYHKKGEANPWSIIDFERKGW